MSKDTGIKDIRGKMISEGDIVRFPKDEDAEKYIVVFIGDGDDMDWAADRLDKTPYAWLDSSCEIVS